MSITFETVEIPSKARSGREAMPNPFTDVFPSDDKALTFTVAEGKDSTEFRRVLRHVRTAAHAVGRTGRVRAVEVEGSKAVEVSVWTVEKIVRKANTPKVAAPKPAAKKAASAKK